MAESDKSLESLRARAYELRRRITFLRASSSLPSFPSTSSASHSSIFHPTSTLSSSSPATQEATELARMYRLTGRSCFAVELARGNRVKEEMGEIWRERKRRRVEEKGKGRADEEEEDGEADGFVRRGTAVRLETFFQGRYYEPYYIVFARRLPDLDKPAVDSELPIYVAHHTIPHWIPLDELSRRYLGAPLEEEEDGDGRRGDAAGEPDLELFLTRLTPYLNAFVSRREQLVSLRSAYSTSHHPSLHFRIFASEPCDRIVIEWQIPSASSREEEDEVEEGKKRIVAQVAFHDLRAERFAEKAEGEEVSLLVRYIEQTSDGREARQLVLHTLTAATLQLAGKERTIAAVVRGLLDETTRAGWIPEG